MERRQGHGGCSCSVIFNRCVCVCFWKFNFLLKVGNKASEFKCRTLILCVRLNSAIDCTTFDPTSLGITNITQTHMHTHAHTYIYLNLICCNCCLLQYSLECTENFAKDKTSRFRGLVLLYHIILYTHIWNEYKSQCGC